MNHIKPFNENNSHERQRDENTLKDIKKFINEFDLKDDLEFKIRTMEYCSKMNSPNSAIITFFSGLKDALIESENDIITKEYIDKYISILDKMISALQD